MSSPRQYGLLPCKLQGGVNHETTGKRPYLVRIHRVLHVVDIHTPDPESPVRSPAEGRIQGSYGNNGLRVRQEVVQHIVLINHLYKTNYSISCSLLRQARLVTALSEALGTM